MNVEEFVSQCLTQIGNALKEHEGFELDDEINFDIPVSTNRDRETLRIPYGDDAKISNYPKLSFSIKPPLGLRSSGKDD